MSEDLEPAFDPRNVALGVAIKGARRESRRTQADLAEAIGISRSSVANIERGSQGIYWSQLCDIATYLCVPVTDLAFPNSELTRRIAEQQAKAERLAEIDQRIAALRQEKRGLS